MSDGIVLCLDTIAESFVLDEKNDSCVLATISRQSIIDLKEEFMICIGANG